MDFLVEIDTTAVGALPPDERDDLVAREWARGRELYENGVLRRLWRLPGQKGNVGLWTARDADELHEAIQSLPIWPYITVKVTALGSHPLFARIDEERSPGAGSSA